MTRTRKRWTLAVLFVTGSVALLAAALLAAPNNSTPPSYGPAPSRSNMTLSLVVGVAMLVAWVGFGIYFLERARRRRTTSGGGAQWDRNE